MRGSSLVAFVLGLVSAVACAKFGAAGATSDTPDSGAATPPSASDAAIDASSGTTPNDGGTTPTTPTPETILDSIKELRSISVVPTALYIGGKTVQKVALPYLPPTTAATVYSDNAVRAVFGFDANSFAYAYDDGVGEVNLGGDGDEDEVDDYGVANDVMVVGTRIIASVGSSVISWPFDFGNEVDFSNDTNALGIANDATDVFWIESSGLLFKTGGLQTKNGVTSEGTAATAATSVAVDAANVYFTSGTQILSLPKTLAGTPAIVATDLQIPISLFLDGTVLYWVEAGTGAIRSASTTAAEAPPQTLAQGSPLTDATYTRLIGVDDRYVYWAQPADGVVKRLEK